MKNPYAKYKKTQVTTASKEKVLLMLYEGAIRFTKHAKVAISEKKIAEKGKYISKTTAILSELMATLDFKQGGQLAVDLENLYVFMIDKLIEANIKNSMEDLDAVEEILMTLYSAWKDVINNPRPDGVPSPTLQPKEYAHWKKTGNLPGQEADDAGGQAAADASANPADQGGKDEPGVKLRA